VAPATPPPGATPSDPPAGSPPPARETSAPPAVEPPDRESGVAGDEALDPAAAAAAVAVAEEFAAIWSTPDPRWHDRLTELATPSLAASLAGADPPEPAPEIAGAGLVYFDAPEWARIGVPAQRGTVVLDVVLTGGEWLVSAVDWWPV
jgi:hypothetical protein